VALEGELRLRLRLRDGRIHGAQLQSSRPDVAQALLRDRTAAELRALVPMLFSVCGRSQAAACELALAAASGQDVDDHTLERWSADVAAEMLRDGVRRGLLDAALRLGEPASADAVQAARLAMAFRPGDASAAQAIAMALFGMSATQWLGLGSLARLDGWIDAGHTAGARLLRQLRDAAASISQATADVVPLLPAQQPAAHIAEWLPPSGTDIEFSHQPLWRGQPAETGALAREQGNALVVALRQRDASRVQARCVARLRELAQLLAGLPQALTGLVPAPDGHGVAWVENARGLLVHQVWLEAERSRTYRIVAPTEWNFHPAGVLPRSLIGTCAADRDAARQHCERLIDSLDPCVSCHVEFDDA
jgi:uptake hydrogenase large subunit